MQYQGKVLVTGATGYVASHVICVLLSKGYSVVGTVRDLKNKSKYDFLFKFSSAQKNLELREADLTKPQSWNNVFDGVKWVIHVASPLPVGLKIQNQDQIIKPAVQGTRAIVSACIKNNIKRIIYTSSSLVVQLGQDNKIPDQNDWSDEKNLFHYPKSKYLAQKLFWQLADQNKNSLEFVSIIPTLIFGPEFTKHYNHSQDYIADMMNGKYPGIPTPNTLHTCVDVRDVAETHVAALQLPDAKGQRYICSGFSIINKDIFDLLRSKYSQLGYQIANNPINAQQIAKSGHGSSLMQLAFLGKKFTINNEKSIKQLGIKYRTAQESITDMVQQMINLGIVQRK